MRRYAAVLGAVMLSAAFMATVAPASAQTPAPAGAPAAILPERSLGKADAPVTIHEYSSLTCGHCANFHATTLPELKKAYIDTGKVRLVFHDYPLDQYALKATLLSRCAPEDRFFPLLDLLFKQQMAWATSKEPAKALSQIGKLAGMSQERMDACWADTKMVDAILAVQLDAQKRFGVDATPAFIFNDGAAKIGGAMPLAEFAKVIDGLLKK